MTSDRHPERTLRARQLCGVRYRVRALLALLVVRLHCLLENASSRCTIVAATVVGLALCAATVVSRCGCVAENVAAKSRLLAATAIVVVALCAVYMQCKFSNELC